VLFIQGGGAGVHDEWDHGSEDSTAPLEHVRRYQRAIPRAVVRELAGRDHQLNNDLSEVAADIRMSERV
jgi:hypothetical protein